MCTPQQMCLLALISLSTLSEEPGLCGLYDLWIPCPISKGIFYASGTQLSCTAVSWIQRWFHDEIKSFGESLASTIFNTLDNCRELNAPLSNTVHWKKYCPSSTQLRAIASWLSVFMVFSRQGVATKSSCDDPNIYLFLVLVHLVCVLSNVALLSHRHEYVVIGVSDM